MTDQLDPARLTELFTRSEALLTPTAPPLTGVLRRAERRRQRRRGSIMWASAGGAAAAVAAIVVVINLAGSPTPRPTSPPVSVTSPTITSTPSPMSPTPTASPTATPHVTYTSYHNARFGFTAAIPDSLTLTSSGLDGDGVTYASSDGLATLAVIAEDNVTSDTPSSFLTASTQELRRAGRTVTYQNSLGSVVTISGTYQDHGKEMAFYERAIIGTGSENFVQWAYPASEKSVYGAQVAHTAETFKAGDVEVVH